MTMQGEERMCMAQHSFRGYLKHFNSVYGALAGMAGLIPLADSLTLDAILPPEIRVWGVVAAPLALCVILLAYNAKTLYKTAQAAKKRLYWPSVVFFVAAVILAVVHLALGSWLVVNVQEVKGGGGHRCVIGFSRVASSLITYPVETAEQIIKDDGKSNIPKHWSGVPLAKTLLGGTYLVAMLLLCACFSLLVLTDYLAGPPDK